MTACEYAAVCFKSTYTQEGLENGRFIYELEQLRFGEEVKDDIAFPFPKLRLNLECMA